MTPDTHTLVGIVLFTVAILAYDILRDRKHQGATISELFWKLTSTSQARRALIVGILLGFLSGHLLWQSQRTYRALQCEASGGAMQCIGGRP